MIKYKTLAIISIFIGGFFLLIGEINISTYFTNVAIVLAILETAK